MEKLSVIIPIFNQEKYLERCVRSVLNQTYTNIEIILVDDGSTDSSAEICDEFCQEHENVVVVHKKNGGLSSARNAGLEMVSGDYVAFIDSDDWVDEKTYEYAFNLKEEYNAEIVQFSYMYAYSTSDVPNQTKEVVKLFHGKDILQYYMSSTTNTGSYGVCWYIIPTKIIENERFREGKINEDIDYMYKILAKCSSLAVSNQVLYYYYQQEKSLSTGGLKEKDFDLYDAAEELYNLAKDEKYGNIEFLARVKKARTPFSLLCKIAMYGIQDKTINKALTVRKLKKELRKNAILLLMAPLSISRKVLVVLFSINYSFSEFLVKQIRKVITL